MYRILLVDDEQNVLNALKRDLRPLMCEIEVYPHPAQALTRAAEVNFDLVISDYRMPGMDGVTLIKALKKLQPGLAVIMLSGLTDLRTIMTDSKGEGVACYLTKPWDADNLKTRVTEALKLRAADNKPSSRTPAVPSPKHAAQKSTGAMAALEAKYPGITQPESDWETN